MVKTKLGKLLKSLPVRSIHLVSDPSMALLSTQPATSLPRTTRAREINGEVEGVVPGAWTGTVAVRMQSIPLFRF